MVQLPLDPIVMFLFGEPFWWNRLAAKRVPAALQQARQVRKVRESVVPQRHVQLDLLLSARAADLTATTVPPQVDRTQSSTPWSLFAITT